MAQALEYLPSGIQTPLPQKGAEDGEAQLLKIYTSSSWVSEVIAETLYQPKSAYLHISCYFQKLHIYGLAYY